MTSIILGIDPGIERLGWAVLKQEKKEISYIDSGVKKTPSKIPTSERLLMIFNFLEEIMKAHRPETLGIEQLFFAKNVKTGIVIGEVRGVILVLGAKYSARIEEFTPPQVKSLICGSGSADKKQVARMVNLTLRLPTRPMLDDETDALAIAYVAALKSYPHIPLS